MLNAVDASETTGRPPPQSHRWRSLGPQLYLEESCQELPPNLFRNNSLELDRAGVCGLRQVSQLFSARFLICNSGTVLSVCIVFEDQVCV